MALRNCKKCGNEVTARANVWAQTGALVKRKTTPLAAGFAFLLIIAACEEPPAESGASTRPPAAEKPAALAPAEGKTEKGLGETPNDKPRKDPGTPHTVPSKAGGEEQNKPEQEGTTQAAAPAVGDYVLRMVYEMSGQPRARFADAVSGNTLDLGVGEALDGWQITEIDLPNNRVVLKDQASEQTITLQLQTRAREQARAEAKAKREAQRRAEEERTAEAEAARKAEEEYDADGLVLLRKTLKARRGQFGGKITGTVVNRRARKLSYAQIEFNLYDESGAQVGTAFDNISGLEPGGRWNFKATTFGTDFAKYKFSELWGW